MSAFKSFIPLALLLAVFASAEAGVTRQANGMIHVGSTATKEFYASETDEVDFMRAGFICGENVFGLDGLASFETPEEIQLVDEWFLQTTGELGGISFWTSGSAGLGGSCGTEWTSSGNPITSPITGPWRPGGGGSPLYLWHQCVTVQRTCFSWSQGSPCQWEGGHGYRTQLVWEECMTEKRFMCERSLV